MFFIFFTFRPCGTPHDGLVYLKKINIFAFFRADRVPEFFWVKICIFTIFSIKKQF